MILTHRFRKEDLRSMLSAIGATVRLRNWKKGDRDLPPCLAGFEDKSIYLHDGTKSGTDFKALMDMNSWKDEPDEDSSCVQGRVSLSRVSFSLILSPSGTLSCAMVCTYDDIFSPGPWTPGPDTSH